MVGGDELWVSGREMRRFLWYFGLMRAKMRSGWREAKMLQEQESSGLLDKNEQNERATGVKIERKRFKNLVVFWA